MRASGNRAIVSTGWRGELSVLDASDPGKPEVVRQVELDGYVSDISMVGSTAVISMGYDGVQTVDLSDQRLHLEDQQLGWHRIRPR